MFGRAEDLRDMPADGNSLTVKQVDFSLIQLGNQYALSVNKEGFIPISDYKIQSSAGGETELCVTIKGIPNELELKASLLESKKLD